MVEASTPALELALRTATVEGFGLRAGEPLRLVARRDDGTRLVQEFAADATGACHVEVVAGSVVVLRAQSEQPSPGEEHDLRRKLELVPGATHTLWGEPSDAGR